MSSKDLWSASNKQYETTLKYFETMSRQLPDNGQGQTKLKWYDKMIKLSLSKLSSKTASNGWENELYDLKQSWGMPENYISSRSTKYLSYKCHSYWKIKHKINVW